MEQPFVTRICTVNGQEAACRFFRPEPDGQDFYCRFEIDWPHQTQTRRAFGVDEVQALLLAMQAAHVELLLARKDGAQVDWLEQASLGLPLTPNLRDLDPDSYF